MELTRGILLLSAFLFVAGTGGHSTSADKVWQTDGTNDNVTGAEAVKSARSKIDCGRLCLQYSHCISWAFDTESGKCYLHPTFGPSQDGATGNVLMFIDTVPLCRESEVPSNLTVTMLQRTLTSLEADVINICLDESKVYAEHVRCLETGQWETVESGPCKKRIWGQGQVSHGGNYAVPFTPSVGWSACLNATPYNPSNPDNWFIINLSNATDHKNRVLFVHVLLHPTTNKPKQVMYLNAMYSGSDFSVNRTVFLEPNNTFDFSQLKYMPKKVYKAFPFTLDQEFAMKITAVGRYRWNVYVDGSLYGYHTVPLPVEDVKFFNPRDDLTIHHLDLWCI